MKNVLFATSEARPLIKTGGLADVSGALPTALRALGVDCRLLLPGYRQVLASLGDLPEVARFEGMAGFADARLLLGSMPDSGTPVYVLDSPTYFQRDGGPYQDTSGTDHADNADRFALLSRVAAHLCTANSPLDWRPELLHCNDWQTGLAPAWLHFAGRPVPSVMTIHNLAFQGIFPPSTVARLGLPASSFQIAGIEYYGNLSFLKAGLFYADRLTTVSPTYAEEIQHEPLGMGMQGLLSSRAESLTGILNGIDMNDWNPAGDPHLPAHYTVRSMSGKPRCKEALQADLNLEVAPQTPLFGVVSRLTHQKGLDWILQVAPGILDRGGQLAVLGTGDKSVEQALRDLVAAYPGRVAATIGYDEGLSHRIEAGADLFLMPSRFEPCGLNQMYSLRYGTPPIVHATGGLRDTVVDGVDGFVFTYATAHGLWLAVERALTAYAEPTVWKRMLQAGMKRDFSWERSARAYLELYERAAAEA
ncbi:glycogen synthase GlgA [Parasulfuritortus cantonensis]|uniref:Glycogen synthase n=1 Tax=Parasulfuritortus cantonensis TaxID=2528202 RepID=A0A4V2NVK5_9PROT|nr:glycogen synthase GlgA [Parasulfuritortus cantonensis]TCJ13832.1 glycogen synthase GlgA [Parasulfuritortus cantonensis]